MASRMIHLAITNELNKQYKFKNIERLRFGAIIPDGASNRMENLKSHFKMKIGDGDERSYDLTGYRNQFGDLMKEDDRQINSYVIDKYQLSDDCFIPDGFEKERMNEIAVFDEYIQWAVEYCKKELEALKGGTVYFNEYEWSWGRA